MAVSITPVAGTLSREHRIAWPLLIEAALVAVALAAILPWFNAFAEHPFGRDGRFAAGSVAVRGLPDSLLPQLCALALPAQPLVRERLCASNGASNGASLDRIPQSLRSATTRATQAFLLPVEQAQLRLVELRAQQRDGSGDVLALGDEIASTETEIQPFIDRYAMVVGEASGPRPLVCASELLQGAFADPRTKPDVRANAVLLLAAALDAHPATADLARAATLPAARAVSARCAGSRMPDTVASLAALITDARGAPAAAAKSQAMQTLLRTAGWQWAGLMIAGLLLLNVSRRPGTAATGIAVALLAFATMAWIARMPWPLSGTTIVFARSAALPLAKPAHFVTGLVAAAACVLVMAPWLRGRGNRNTQTPASVFGYPGLVVATGIGWIVLLDLSANGNAAGRYLALYHQAHLWLAMLAFCVIAFVRHPLGAALAWTLSLVEGIASRIGRSVGGFAGTVLLSIAALALTVVVGALLLNVRQLTSEIGRVWLVIGAAWFFFLRGTPFTERLAQSGGSIGSLVRYVSPLVFVVIVLIGAMLITRDMGPLLIAAYAAGAFIAASIAMWWYQRRGAIASAYAIAVVLFVGWLVVTTLALLRFGAVDETTAGRLENAAAPLASANDQLALVTWFQRAAPARGFGPGAVPWCGFGTPTICAGVPGQIQSDYTFTALVGMFGWAAAWALTIATALWLNEIIRGHAKATRGEPRLVRIAGRMNNDAQAFVSWICVTWVVLALCQLAVTVAGNLAVIPLTGVTFPFVSFGKTSLVLDMSMLAFAIDVNRYKAANG